MPIYRRPIGGDEAAINSLRNDLVEELRGPKPLGQPIILEDCTPQTDSMRVHVVWDRWTECPRELRQQLIMDAYKEALGEKLPHPITLAMGLTVPEAVEIGLLPFRIAPAQRRSDSAADAEYHQTMLKAGASTLFEKEVPQLRFASLENAEVALASLEAELPGSKWLVIQEVPETFGSTSSITTTSFSIPSDR